MHFLYLCPILALIATPSTVDENNYLLVGRNIGLLVRISAAYTGGEDFPATDLNFWFSELPKNLLMSRALRSVLFKSTKQFKK